jgi:hypothetical protein
MSELDAFEAKVRSHIKLLSATDAGKRRKAAIWLGEAGDPSAIRKLRSLYENDPDAKVRRAAADSLAMFRALEQGMHREDNESVYQLLEDIALRGKMGKRVAIPVATLSRVLFGLLISLLILLVFNFVVWPRFGPQLDTILAPASSAPAENSAAPDRAIVIEALNSRIATLRQDAQTLQSIYLNPASLNCTASFNNPGPYAADSVPGLSDIATRLNGEILNLATAKSTFTQACAGGESALNESQVAGPLGTLDSLLTSLDSIEADLMAAENG